jgi:hypothetical protein
MFRFAICSLDASDWMTVGLSLLLLFQRVWGWTRVRRFRGRAVNIVVGRVGWTKDLGGGRDHILRTIRRSRIAHGCLVLTNLCP